MEERTIFDVRQLSDGKNVIFDRVVVSGDAGPDFKRYLVNLRVPVAQNREGQTLVEEATVEFDCDSPAEAFAHLYEVMPDLIQGIQKRAHGKMAASRLQLPPSAAFNRNGA